MKKSLIVIAVLLIAALGGWVAYAQNQDNNQKSQNAQATLTDPTESGKYLVIKEWGVRMKLNDKIKGAKYKFTEDGKGVYLSTLSVERVTGCQFGNIFAIERAKKGETIGNLIFDDVPAGQVNPFVKVSEYYYHLVGPGLGCAQQGDEQGQLLLGQTRQGLSEAYHMLEQVPDN